MRKFCSLALATAVALLIASHTIAQQRQGGRGPGGGGGISSFMLLSQKSVQDELKLTDDQSKKVAELTKKQREAFQGLQDLDQQERRQKMAALFQENEKAVASILQPEQAKRLKQISLQQQGSRALGNPEIAKELNLSDEQKQQIRGIQQATFDQMRTIREQTTDRQEARKKTAELTKSANEKVQDVLTADQKAKWKEMTGEPFKGEINLGFPGGGRGRRPGQR